MCTDRLTELDNAQRVVSRSHPANDFPMSTRSKLASRLVNTPPPMRGRRISPHRSRSSMKRFALSLLASATLLAISSPGFAFSYTYVDRYPEPITTDNAWQPVEVNEERPLQFEGDYVIGFHGKDPDPYSSSTDGTSAMNVTIGTSHTEINELTITGGTLHIVERPLDSLHDQGLTSRAIELYESTRRDNGPTTFTVDATLDLDLQSLNQKLGERLKGHGAFTIDAVGSDVRLNVITNKPVNGLFYSTVGYLKQGGDNSWPQGFRLQNSAGGVFHYTAKDTVDMKVISTESNTMYGLHLESQDLTTNDASAHFEKDATFYLQAQKGAPSWLYGTRIAGFKDASNTDTTGKAVLSNREGSTYRVAIETANEVERKTYGVGLYLVGNTRLAMAGKTELSFWEDPDGKASWGYIGLYGVLEANSSKVQHYDNTFNELAIDVSAPLAKSVYGISLSDKAGVEAQTQIAKATIRLNTNGANPYGINIYTTNTGSQQHFTVSDTLTIETEAPSHSSTLANFSSEAHGVTMATLHNLTLKSTGRLNRGLVAKASGDGSVTEISITGNVSNTTPVADNNSALFYAETQTADRALIDFTGGGTFGMDQGATIISIGENALINLHPTLATQITGFGGTYSQGKIDIHLIRSDQKLQMSLVEDRESNGVVDVKLENQSQWVNIGPISQINSLTLNTGGRVDLREGTGKDAQGTLGQAFLYTKTLRGDGGNIALNVNTESNLGQILVIEEASEGNHTVSIANQANGVATGVPIKIIESLGGETSDAFKATFKEATPSVEVGELKYYVVKTNDAKAMYATLNGATTDESAEHTSDNASEHASDHAGPAADSTADTTPSPNVRRRVARAAAVESTTEEGTNDAEATAPTIVTDIAADTNPNNWYLAPRRVAPEPEPTPLPDFTDTAKGVLSTASVQYLAAMLPLETLRERLGDIHTFKPLDNKATPWVKLSGTEWRVKPTLTQDTWDVNFAHAKVGVDTRVGDKSLVGGYLAYSRFDTQHPAPAFVKGTGLEGGLYWTYLSENRTFSDLVLRVGRVESKFDTTDTRGMSVKARDIDNTYWGLTWNVGRQVPLTQTVVLEPMALVGYTRFGSTRAVSSSGLTGDTRGYDGLLTMLGSTVEGRFTTSSGKPWTLYGKLFWEKEWLADTDIVFNGHNTYRTDFKDHRWVYGFGIEGTLGKASTWHVDVERSTGSAFQENWQVNAGLRIPF